MKALSKSQICTSEHNSAAAPLPLKVLSQPMSQQLPHSPGSLPGHRLNNYSRAAVPQGQCNPHDSLVLKAEVMSFYVL